MLCCCSLNCVQLFETHKLQHAKLPRLLLSPWVCSDSYPLSHWGHPIISSSCPQSFPPSGSFPMSQLFPSGGQSIGASAPVFPVNIQGWFPLGLTSSISLLSKGLSRVSSSTTAWKHQFFSALLLYGPTVYMTTGKARALTICTSGSKVMALLFNMLSRLVIVYQFCWW